MMTRGRLLNEPQRILAKSPRELVTAIMRLWGYLDNGFADA